MVWESISLFQWFISSEVPLFYPPYDIGKLVGPPMTSSQTSLNTDFHSQITSLGSCGDLVIPTRPDMPTNVKSQDWEDRKPRIRKLYVEKGYPLRVVKEKMETPGFQPS